MAAWESRVHVAGRLAFRRFRVSLQVTQEITASDEDEALGIFWDDLQRTMADQEVATVEEI
jgi:hypothetical protein